jgi:hypothetical protein
MRRYLVIFALTATLVVAATAVLAWFVDPYAYWNAPRVEGVNRYRPASGKHLEAVKLRQYARLSPNTIIAGNSRVDVGFDPASSAWPQGMQPVYNLGFPGYGVEGVARTIEKALFVSQPRVIFVGLDFLDFRLDGDERAEVTPLSSPDWQETLALDAKLLISIDALTDTLSALAEQRARYPADITPQGFNSLSEYHSVVDAEGHAALFRQRNRENIKAYLKGSKTVRDAGGGNPNFAVLQRLVETAKRKRIMLVFFTYPYHADVLLSFQKAGLWPAYEDWLRDLAAFSARNAVFTYDFTRIDELTGEGVPPPGDTKTDMKWYWEAGHFKSALGDRMILIMNTSLDDRLLLSPENVDARLAELREGLAVYGQQHPEALRRIDEAVEGATR